MGHSTPTRQRLVDLPWRDFVQGFVNSRELSEKLFDAVTRLVRSRNYNHPAHLYSPTLVWDEEGHSTIAIDVLSQQVKDGELEKMYLANRTDTEIYGHFRNAIDWEGLRIARSRGARGHALYRQLKALLKKHEAFQMFESLGWGLREWKDQEWQRIPEKVVWERVRSIEVPSPQITRRKGRKRRASDKILAAFCENFLQCLGYPAELRMLVASASVHFNVYDPVACQIPTYTDKESGEKRDKEFADERTIFPAIEAKRDIENLAAKLKPQERLYLQKLGLEEWTQQELMILLGARKSTVSMRKIELERKLKKLIQKKSR